MCRACGSCAVGVQRRIAWTASWHFINEFCKLTVVDGIDQIGYAPWLRLTLVDAGVLWEWLWVASRDWRAAAVCWELVDM